MSSRDELIQEARRRLLKQRKSLEGVARTTKEASATVELDQTRIGRLSRMDAMQSQAMAKELGRRSERELAGVIAALQRIEEGEYGLCRRCEEEIGKARLRANPAAALCIDCADGRGPR